MTTISKVWWKKTLLSWYTLHGRHDLPWQQHLTPYRCWISEIMLQQTQVATVIPYFERFITHFPTVEVLAEASMEAVLSLWSGLGYYARGRNVHRAAQMIVSDFKGIFPNTAETLLTLPGIGPSTAHAILAQAFGQPAAILDGNVKRVLCRFFGVGGALNEPSVLKILWDLANTYLPSTHAPEYAQVMMDLGALLCTQTKPQCLQCPLQAHCIAFKMGDPTQFPKKIKHPPKPTQTDHFLLLTAQDKIGLLKKPDSGVWGGLWCLPSARLLPTQQAWKLQQEAGPYKHSFTHFHLQYWVSWHRISHVTAALLNITWILPEEALNLGLPAPIRAIIRSYHENNLLPKVKAILTRA